MHVVNSLNAGKNPLKTLKIRHISRYTGQIERLRPQVDALLEDPKRAPLAVPRRHDRTDQLPHEDLKRFMVSAYHVMDALLALECRVGLFEIYGDLPGDVVERLCRRFNAKLPEKMQHRIKLSREYTAHDAMPSSGHSTSSTSLASAPVIGQAAPPPTFTIAFDSQDKQHADRVLFHDYEIRSDRLPKYQYSAMKIKQSGNRPWNADLAIYAWVLGPDVLETIRRIDALESGNERLDGREVGDR